MIIPGDPKFTKFDRIMIGIIVVIVMVIVGISLWMAIDPVFKNAPERIIGVKWLFTV